jgi:succinyl-CoA synthetase alpha subunit
MAINAVAASKAETIDCIDAGIGRVSMAIIAVAASKDHRLVHEPGETKHRLHGDNCRGCIKAEHVVGMNQLPQIAFI